MLRKGIRLLLQEVAWPMNEEEESAMLLGSIYGDLAGLMQEDAPAPTEPIHFNPFFDHFCHCGH